MNLTQDQQRCILQSLKWQLTGMMSNDTDELTRSTQTAQTSTDRQHNTIAEMIRNGLPDPDSDPDRHQYVISWSPGHTPALHKISSKSVGNFFDNPVNPDFGLLDPNLVRATARRHFQ